MQKVPFVKFMQGAAAKGCSMPCPETLSMPVWDIMSWQPAGAPSQSFGYQLLAMFHRVTCLHKAGSGLELWNVLLLGIRKGEQHRDTCYD